MNGQTRGQNPLFPIGNKQEMKDQNSNRNQQIATSLVTKHKKACKKIGQLNLIKNDGLRNELLPVDGPTSTDQSIQLVQSTLQQNNGAVSVDTNQNGLNTCTTNLASLVNELNEIPRMSTDKSSENTNHIQ